MLGSAIDSQKYVCHKIYSNRGRKKVQVGGICSNAVKGEDSG